MDYRYTAVLFRSGHKRLWQRKSGRGEQLEQCIWSSISNGGRNGLNHTHLDSWAIANGSTVDQGLENSGERQYDKEVWERWTGHKWGAVLYLTFVPTRKHLPKCQCVLPKVNKRWTGWVLLWVSASLPVRSPKSWYNEPMNKMAMVLLLTNAEKSYCYC